jgi:hypothetical protein
VVAHQQHGFGERHRVDDDEARGDEHGPAAGESVQRADEHQEERNAENDRHDPSHGVTVGEEQRSCDHRRDDERACQRDRCQEQGRRNA